MPPSNIYPHKTECVMAHKKEMAFHRKVIASLPYKTENAVPRMQKWFVCGGKHLNLKTDFQGVLVIV